jgi:hypothetical protein
MLLPLSPCSVREAPRCRCQRSGGTAIQRCFRSAWFRDRELSMIDDSFRIAVSRKTYLYTFSFSNIEGRSRGPVLPPEQSMFWWSAAACYEIEDDQEIVLNVALRTGGRYCSTQRTKEYVRPPKRENALVAGSETI